MHSSLIRIQNVFGFFSTVACVLAGLVAASVFFFPQTPSASIELRNVQVVKGRPHYHSTKREEYAIIRFDLEADLTSLFNWNTKQLFVWVAANYPSSQSTVTSPLSQAIIWDTIINSPAQANPPSIWSFLSTKDSATPPPLRKSAQSKVKTKKVDPSKPDPDAKPGALSLKNVKPKYQITDITGLLAERNNVTLTVGWNVQPWVGALQWQDSQHGPLGWFAFRWQEMVNGRSKAFDFPALVGKKKKEVPATEDVVIGKGEVPRPGEATPVVKI